MTASVSQPLRVRRVTALISLVMAPVVVGLSLLSENPVLTLAVIITAVFLSVLLFRPGEPPVLLFAMGIQWLQVSTKVFQADFQNVPISDLLVYYGDLTRTVLAASLGLAIMAVGMRWGVGRLQPNLQEARQEVLRMPIRRVWALYLIGFLANIFLANALAISSGLFQIMLALLSVKWALLSLLAYAVMARSRGYGYLFAAVALEVATGFGGFFGGFKTVFFIVLIGGMTARIRVSAAMGASLAVAGVILISMSIFWSAIKVDYRDFLNRGSGQQVVDVPVSDRIDYIVNAAEKFDEEDFRRGTNLLLERVIYIDFLAAVFDYVPNVEPFANGARTIQAVVHILTPRLIFPWKPPAPNDSDVTRQYTGISVSGEAQGTSISIGYFAECYIDFGPIFMYIPILALGWISGWMYRFLLLQERNLLATRFGLAVMVLFGLASFETALLKTLGGLVITFLAAWLISRFFAHRVERWLVSGGGVVVSSP